MSINRYSAKSAPPELYLQHKAQLQQVKFGFLLFLCLIEFFAFIFIFLKKKEEDSYLYTKEYRDYYKEQNNPRL